MKWVVYTSIVLLLLFIIYETTILFGAEKTKFLSSDIINPLIKPTVTSIPSPTITPFPTPTIPQPSERALKAVTWGYIRFNEKQKEEFRKKWGTIDKPYAEDTKVVITNKKTGEKLEVKQSELYKYGNLIELDAIKNCALSIDQNPTKLALIEQTIAKDEQDKNRQTYQQPDVIVRPIIEQQQPPIIQQPLPKSNFNCFSNTIGDYTYTNCY